MRQSKLNWKQLAIMLAVALLAGLFVGIWISTRPEVSSGSKTVTVQIVHKDNSEKEFTYHTNEEYLGPLLQSQGLVEGETGQFGLYIKVVDGEKADYDTDGAYWALYQGEDYAAQGADATPLKDGDTFRLVYTAAAGG